MKEQLRNELIMAAQKGMDDDELDEFKDRLTMILSNYDIAARETHLALRDEDINKELVFRFLTAKAASGLSDRTLKYYRKEIPKALERMGRTATEVTPDDIRVWMVTRIRKDQVSTVTAGNEFRCLSSFFQWMQREEVIFRNPFNKVEHPKKLKARKKKFTDFEIEKIRGECRTERETAIVEMLLSTWCRVSELINIKINDIQEDRITVLGKGNKERTVYLNARAQFALQRYLSTRSDINPYVFPAMKGSSNGKHLTELHFKGVQPSELKYWYKNPEYVDKDKHTDKGSIEGIIREMGKRAGVDKTHPHRFRRTGATKALENGMPILTVSKILGHESVGTTQIYLDISEDNIEHEHRKYVQ